MPSEISNMAATSEWVATYAQALTNRTNRQVAGQVDVSRGRW
ncbi:MAG TPA: hypothetical protein VF258_11945 [Luteolibacter sp.]